MRTLYFTKSVLPALSNEHWLQQEKNTNMTIMIPIEVYYHDTAILDKNKEAIEDSSYLMNN